MTGSCTIVAQCTGVVPMTSMAYIGELRLRSPRSACSCCGSCIPELKRLIAQTSVAGAEQRQLARVAN
jgi:NAD(P)H-nitrite reductase large subunit